MRSPLLGFDSCRLSVAQVHGIRGLARDWVLWCICIRLVLRGYCEPVAVLWWWAIPVGITTGAYLWVAITRRPERLRRSQSAMQRMNRFRTAMRDGRRHG